MVENLTETLRAKNWSEEEIERAVEIIEEGDKNKPKWIKFLDKAIYWIALLFTMVGNTVISLFLIPFILFTPALFLYPFIALIGIIFGSLYALILWDIENIHGAKQVLPNVFLPATAIINLYVILTLANFLVEQTAWEVEAYSSFGVAWMYVVAFMIPYWYTQHSQMFEKVFSRKKNAKPAA